MNEHTLRFELKIIKSEDLKELEIKTFADINESALNNVKELILKRLNEVVFYDKTINKKGLNNKQKQDLKLYSNPRYWIDELQPNRRYKPKMYLSEIITNNSQELKKKIRLNIIKKCVIINRTFEDAKSVIINTSNIGLNVTQNTNRKLM